MRKFVPRVFLFFFLFFLTLNSSRSAFAQFDQVWETIVGNPDLGSFSGGSDEDSGDAGDGGSVEDPPAGIFMPPFSCNIIYAGSTYAGSVHVWEIDFNRRGCGQDLGDPLYAVAPGVATAVSPSLGRVIIRHDNGVYSLYGHMKNIKVRNNDRVNFRQQIGQIGSVGTTGGPHLHFGQYKSYWPNMIPVVFDGKKHPASLPGNITIDANSCKQVGPVNCKILY